jgi:hypothetical protein
MDSLVGKLRGGRGGGQDKRPEIAVQLQLSSAWGVDMNEVKYCHIGPRASSNYRQYFVNGTRTRAETIYRYVVGPDSQTPEQVADDCGLPIEAVMECIRYCEVNRDLLQEELTADWSDIANRGLIGDSRATEPIKFAS